jgi:hypothetical protein
MKNGLSLTRCSFPPSAASCSPSIWTKIGCRWQLELAAGQGDASIEVPEYHLARAELLVLGE